LTDIKDGNEKYFDEEILSAFALTSSKLSAQDFNNQLLKKIDEFIGEESYPDDFTVLTCKIFKK
jgi:sigma-B regulation protein RsbU (phosphoserine phosphatase)